MFRKMLMVGVMALSVVNPVLAQKVESPGPLPPPGSCGDAIASSALEGAASMSCGFEHVPSDAAVACRGKLSGKDWAHWLLYGAAGFDKIEKTKGHDAACKLVIDSIPTKAIEPEIPAYTADQVCGKGMPERTKGECVEREQEAKDVVISLWPELTGPSYANVPFIFGGQHMSVKKYCHMLGTNTGGWYAYERMAECVITYHEMYRPHQSQVH